MFRVSLVLIYEATNAMKTTPNNLYNLFKQYLVTWINIIAKERRLYPFEAFEYHNSFNLRVPVNRHPAVIEWINGLVDELMEDVVFKHTVSIVLVIYKQEVKEKYSIDLKEFLHISKDYYDKEIKDMMDWMSVIDEFRGNLYTLLQEIRQLPPLDGSYKFQVSIETKDISLNTNWVLDKPSTFTSTNDAIPLQVVDVGPIVFFSSITLN